MTDPNIPAADDVVIPLPTWTDPTSVATYVTALAGAALTIIAIVKPGWHPNFSVQAASVAIGTLVAGAAMVINVIRHTVVTKAMIALAAANASVKAVKFSPPAKRG